MPVRSQLVLAAVFALLLAPACSGPVAAGIAVGDPAPDFKLPDLDGAEVSLSAFRGKVVVLEWINPNCPFSRRHSEEKTMTRLAAEHPDVVWLAINSTRKGHGDFLEPTAHRAFNQRNGIVYPVLYDSSGEVGHAYGARTTPHMYVIDPEGKLAYAGAIDDSPSGQPKVNHVAHALEALASGTRPNPASTQPYGCSVKY